MQSPLDELTSQLARSAARELDKRLLWDMICASRDVPFQEMAIGEWPDGSKSVVRRVEAPGEVPEILGPKHKASFDFSERSIQVTVR